MRPERRPTGRRRSLIQALAAVLVATAACTAALPAAPSSSQAAAGTAGGCTATAGAVVAVDFGRWGGPLLTGCDPNPTTGMNLLHDGGFTTTGTVHDGPGFVCRIGSAQFDGGTQYPTPAEDPCVVTPPASAYWSYWIAPPGQDTWTYSPLGALSDVPVNGEVEAWTFGATNVSGTSGQPDFTPDSVRPGGGSVPASASPTGASPAGTTSPAPQANLAKATAYLDGRLTSGGFVSTDGAGDPNYDLTAQLGIALAATGQDNATLTRVVNYLDTNIDAAIYLNGTSAPPDPTDTGEIALLTEIVGGDPSSVGGQDLLTDLTDNVCTAVAASLGNCTGVGDFYGAGSPFTQATDLLVLARAQVPIPPTALTRLTQMQCSDGGFPGSMITPGQPCQSENDMTGLAVQTLFAVGGESTALSSAQAALLAAQRSDGGFLPYAGATASDTESTALDAQALWMLGQGGPANAALGFVDSQQQSDGGCEADATAGGSDIYTTLTAVPAAAGADLVTLYDPLPGTGPTQSPSQSVNPRQSTTPSQSTGPSQSPSQTPTGTPTGTGPNLVKGSAYLVSSTNLVDGDYYSPFGGGYADWGLTIDGAFALAATGDQDSVLKGMVQYMEADGDDGAGTNVDSWTGVGTPYVSGGAVGKEALLAEVVGADPRSFGGLNLIAQLDDSICQAASTGSNTQCAAQGNYYYSSSTFDQALGIMAQMRAGDSANAAEPVAYLLSLQHANGSFPSLIPPTGDDDVDSTAMAAMALALVPGQQSAVAKAVSWIAAQQVAGGGFMGASGDSTDSTGLAIQGLDLEPGQYTAQIDDAETFLAGQQNSDGGFNVAAGGQPGSDVRASTQALGGAVGTSFGTLSIDLSGVNPPPTLSTTPAPTPSTSTARTTAPSHQPTTGGPTPEPPPTSGYSAPAQNPPTNPYQAYQEGDGVPPENAVTTAPAMAGGPMPSTTYSSRPGVAAGTPSATPTQTRKIADAAASASETINPLWWMTIAVAAALAMTIAALFTRRRRLGGRS